MATWKVGVSKVDITPTFPVYMAGYGNRTQKHDDVLAPIFARCLALEDASGTRAVQLSLELLGASNELVDSVREAVAAHGVEGAAVRLTATHTHSAPSLPNTCASSAPTPTYLDFTSRATAPQTAAAARRTAGPTSTRRRRIPPASRA